MRAVFVGDRLGVLSAMMEAEIMGEGLGEKLDLVAVLLLKNSFAHKNLHTLEKIPNNIVLFGGKSELLERLNALNYELLVSNGCPFILPISRLKNQNKNRIFINIHPSLLPSLRGRHPINGAILFDLPAGVSVHTMSDEIDRGEICAQIEIPTQNLPLALLYKLCFEAEGEAFRMAWERGFAPLESPKIYAESYFSCEGAIALQINEPNEVFLRKINAFALPHKATKLITNKGEIRVLSARKIKNPYLEKIAARLANCEVVACYEKNILLFKDGEFLELEILENAANLGLKKGALLWSESGESLGESGRESRGAESGESVAGESCDQKSRSAKPGAAISRNSMTEFTGGGALGAKNNAKTKRLRAGAHFWIRGWICAGIHSGAQNEICTGIQREIRPEIQRGIHGWIRPDFRTAFAPNPSNPANLLALYAAAVSPKAALPKNPANLAAKGGAYALS